MEGKVPKGIVPLLFFGKAGWKGRVVEAAPAAPYGSKNTIGFYQ